MHYTWLYVTRFVKTRLPHTQNQTYDFTGNGLLAQHTIIFPLCSLLRNQESDFCGSLFLTISLEWWWCHWLSLGMVRGLGKPRRAGQCLSTLIWNAVSTCKEGLVRPEIESLDFCCLCTSLYTPILSPPSTCYLYYYHVPSSWKKLCKMCNLKVLHPHNYS